MPKITRLYQSGLLDHSDIKSGAEIPSQLRKRCRLVYEGSFESADGPVEVTEDQLQLLAKNHNAGWSKLKRMFSGKEVPVGLGRPMQLDHTKSGWDTIGRFAGELAVEDFIDPFDEVPKKGLFGDVMILGRDNVERVLDGRWSNLSIGADFDNGIFHELTVTPFPAAESATMLSKPSIDNKKATTGEPSMKFHLMKKRAERYFKLSKKMSDEDTEKELKRLEDADDEEELKKLANEMDEDEETKAKEEQERKDQEKKEKTEKLTAAKTNITRLSSDFRSALGGAQLKAKTASIYHRLSAIRASGRITPAEIKKLNVTELAGKPDDTIASVIKSYEDRQPVIMVGQIGSMRTLTHDEIMQKHRRVEYQGQPISELEARVRHMHKRISDEDYKKLQGQFAKLEKNEYEPGEDVVNIHVDTDPHADFSAMESDYNDICAMIDQHNGQGAKDCLKKLMERFKSRGAYGMSEPAMHESSSEQLAALQKDIVQLTAKFDEAIGLAESLAGGI